MTDNLKESDILIIKKIHAAWGNYDDPENGLIPYHRPTSLEPCITHIGNGFVEIHCDRGDEWDSEWCEELEQFISVPFERIFNKWAEETFGDDIANRLEPHIEDEWLVVIFELTNK